MELYRKVTNALKQSYPEFTVSVRRVKVPKGIAGDCHKSNGIYKIRIDRELNETSAIDTLLHEFAHVPSWSEWCKHELHGPQWADHYAKCYRIYEQIVS